MYDLMYFIVAYVICIVASLVLFCKFSNDENNAASVSYAANVQTKISEETTCEITPTHASTSHTSSTTKRK